MFSLITKVRTYTFFDNQIDPFLPEWWANEMIFQLQEALVLPDMVNRDYEAYFAKGGQVINVPKPGLFKAIRKSRKEEITIQDLDADEMQIRLDHHVHVSFAVDDVENTMSDVMLSELYAKPQARAMADYINDILMARYAAFLPYNAGKLNGLTALNIKDAIIDLRQVMNANNAPYSNRNLMMTSSTESNMLRPEWFVQADRRGDNGTALRDASLGRTLGFDLFRSNTAPNVSTPVASTTAAVNNTAGYPVGTTVITWNGTGAMPAGSWIKIADKPYHVIANTGTVITLEWGLKDAVANSSVITCYTPRTTNANYADKYDRALSVTGVLQKGQFLTFGTGTDRYVVIEAVISGSNTLITLDRAVAGATTSGSAVNPGPDGNYSMAFNQDAITLAIRPLKPVASGAGALSALASFGNLTMRATIGYDIYKQQHVWTMDFLAGTGVLNEHLGAVLLG